MWWCELVNQWYDYIPNLSPLGPVNIINNLCHHFIGCYNCDGFGHVAKVWPSEEGGKTKCIMKLFLLNI